MPYVMDVMTLELNVLHSIVSVEMNSLDLSLPTLIATVIEPQLTILLDVKSTPMANHQIY